MQHESGPCNIIFHLFWKLSHRAFQRRNNKQCLNSLKQTAKRVRRIFDVLLIIEHRYMCSRI